MPSLLIKLIKSMKKNSVVEMTTTKVEEKLHKNFKSDFLDQYTAFKDGDTVKFTVSLFGIEHTSYFYKLPVTQKIAYVQRLKATAGAFFKVGNYKKAAKVYQKINGYYNFGDSTNNHAKEEGEQFEKDNAELQGLKIVCFTNLVVCKFKVKEFTSVIGITEQILEMEKNHQKGLYFRAKAQVEVADFSDAIETFTTLCTLVPENKDFRKELDRARKLRINEQ